MYAFPNQHNPQTGRQETGMTLRDYFAAQALVAYIKESDDRFPLNQIVRSAWEAADEMLKVRGEL